MPAKTMIFGLVWATVTSDAYYGSIYCVEATKEFKYQDTL